MEEFQLQPLTHAHDGVAHRSNEPVAAGNGNGRSCPSERDGLLSAPINGGHGETMPSAHEVEAQRRSETKTNAVCKFKDELNDVVFWKVKIWMIIIFMCILIVAVILISLVLCTVIHEDVDEQFDSSLFDVPRYFNGSFQLPNQVFTEELLSLSSNESQTLVAELRDKLSDLYRTSPALGRYFSKAEIYDLRNGSVIADYQLTFVMPADQQDQLRHFTLSREMVYNVFRQLLYDQDTEETEPMYIDPASLNMF